MRYVHEENPLEDVFVELKVINGTNATVACASLLRNTLDEVYSTGEAKRLPGDHYDETIGRDLSVGRALQKLGHSLEKAALKRCGAL